LVVAGLVGGCDPASTDVVANREGASTELSVIDQSSNPCVSLDGNVPRWCIMRADRFFASDPFIKHRSCGVTDLAVVEVDIDHGVVSKTAKPIPEEALNDLIANAATVAGVPVPVFPDNRLINYWNVLDPDFNPITSRVLLRSMEVTDLGGPFIDTEDPSPQAQALIRLLDEQCPPLEPVFP
jgi:hypothetical protein